MNPLLNFLLCVSLRLCGFVALWQNSATKTQMKLDVFPSTRWGQLIFPESRTSEIREQYKSGISSMNNTV